MERLNHEQLKTAAADAALALHSDTRVSPEQTLADLAWLAAEVHKLIESTETEIYADKYGGRP